MLNRGALVFTACLWALLAFFVLVYGAASFFPLPPTTIASAPCLRCLLQRAARAAARCSFGMLRRYIGWLWQHSLGSECDLHATPRCRAGRHLFDQTGTGEEGQFLKNWGVGLAIDNAAQWCAVLAAAAMSLSASSASEQQ